MPTAWLRDEPRNDKHDLKSPERHEYASSFVCHHSHKFCNKIQDELFTVVRRKPVGKAGRGRGRGCLKCKLVLEFPLKIGDFQSQILYF